VALPAAKYTRGDGGRGTANRWTSNRLQQFNTWCECVKDSRSADNNTFDEAFAGAAAVSIAARRGKSSAGAGGLAPNIIQVYNDLDTDALDEGLSTSSSSDVV
jgi:hypothetical protein